MGNKDLKTPLATVDIIIEMDGGVVLVRRRRFPRTRSDSTRTPTTRVRAL